MPKHIVDHGQIDEREKKEKVVLVGDVMWVIRGVRGTNIQEHEM